MAAWASGGHRPGQTSHSWGEARVNSFLVGGKAFFTADNKLARELPKKVYNAIVKERVWKENPAFHIALKNSFDDYSEDGMSYTELDLPHRSNDMTIIYRRNKSMRRNSALVPSMADRLPQQGKLTRRERASLPKKAFVFPSRAPGPGSYPIPNIHYAKLALNMASWSPKGKEELPEILPIVLKKYPQLKNWDLIDRYYDIADEEGGYAMAANPRYTPHPRIIRDRVFSWLEDGKPIAREATEVLDRKYDDIEHLIDVDEQLSSKEVQALKKIGNQIGKELQKRGEIDFVHEEHWKLNPRSYQRHRHNFHHNPGYRRNMATKHQDLKALRAKYRNKFGNEWYTMPRAYAAFQEEKKGLASTIAREEAIAKRSAGKSKASKAKRGSIALPGPTGYDCYPRKSNPDDLWSGNYKITSTPRYSQKEIDIYEQHKRERKAAQKRRPASKRRSTAKRKTRKPTAAECAKCRRGTHTWDSFRKAHKGMYTQKQLSRHWKQYKRKHGIK